MTFRIGPCAALLWLIFLCALPGLSALASAQINVESLTDRVTGPGWGGGAKSTLAYSSGNVDFFEMRGELSAYFATDHPDAEHDKKRFWFLDRVLAYGSAGLKTASGEEVANDGYAHVRYTRMQWMRFGGEVFGQAQYDEFRLLTRRLVAGTGARMVVVSMPFVSAWWGTGPMVEQERRNIEPDNQPPLGPDVPNVVNYRWNNYATVFLTFVPDVFSLVATAYVQPRFDAFSDLQVLQEGRLQFKVGERVLITTDMALRFDSRPPVSVERRDLRVGNGLLLVY